MVPTNTLFTRALSAPLDLIDELAKSNTPADLPQAVGQAFEEAFGDRESRSRVPFLTAKNAESLVGKTVRWRGMVQDNSVSRRRLEIITQSKSSHSRHSCPPFA